MKRRHIFKALIAAPMAAALNLQMVKPVAPKLADDGITPKIYNKLMSTNPWNKLIRADRWPDNMRDDISIMTYGHNEPSRNSNSDSLS